MVYNTIIGDQAPRRYGDLRLVAEPRRPSGDSAHNKQALTAANAESIILHKRKGTESSCWKLARGNSL